MNIIAAGMRNSLPVVDGLGKLQLTLALLFIAASAAPALYISPIILAFLIYNAIIQMAVFVASGYRGKLAYPYYSLFALLMLIYCIFNAMLSGLKINEIFNYDAIRYDGNIFYSFLPFFVFTSTGACEINVDRWIRAISLLAPVTYVIAEALGYPIFESHNAAGGYFMVLLAYVLGRIETDNLHGWRLPLVFLLMALIVSDSRGSLGAVLIVFIIYKASIVSPRTVKAMMVLGALCIIGALAYAYSFWHSNGSVFLYDYAVFAPNAEGLDFSAFMIGERPGTVLHRIFFLYPMAIDMFLHSPIFGVGFTRFDDFPIQYGNGINLISMNVTGSIQHTNFHAHNSYLHILSELGLLGLVLFALLIRGIFRAFRQDKWTGIPARFMLGALLVASMTEHRLTTPSQAAPVFIMIGVLWACSKSRNRC